RGPVASSPRGSAREVFRACLRLGLTSFGGPIAHIEYQRRAFVVDRHWLPEPDFAELVALCQTLPGPASSQLTIAVGRLRAGWAGALAAWLGFTLPSAVLMTLIGLAAAGAHIPETGPVAGAIRGLEVAAVAIVANALLTMRSRLAPDAPRLLLAIAATIVLLILPAPIAQLSVIGAGAILGRLFLGRVVEPARSETFSEPAAVSARPRLDAGRRREAIALAAAFVAVVAGSQLVASISGNPDLGLAAAFVRAGALVFGGGHVVLPLLNAGVVQPGWVTSDQFLAGYGAAQAMPGPLFSFAAYLGAVAAVGPGGVAGAILGTIAIFLPGALLVLAAVPVVGWLRGRPGVASALVGVNATVVGMLAAALINPVATSALTSPLAVVVAALAATLLIVAKVPPLVVVAGCAAAMAAGG
ncbi:MAG TPA: chromate efflux transporter, partial [Candidatus Limnocylindrales bacterium]